MANPLKITKLGRLFTQCWLVFLGLLSLAIFNFAFFAVVFGLGNNTAGQQ